MHQAATIAALEALLAIFVSNPRVIVAGGPKTGKSTFAVRAGERHGRPVRHSDSLVGHYVWGDDSAEVATWFDEPGPWIIEGVSTPRAIRKWLAAHPGTPLDAAVLYFREPLQRRSKGQETMARGTHTVWLEVASVLRRLGVNVIERDV